MNINVNFQISGGRFVTEAPKYKGLNAKTGSVIISSAHAGHSDLLRGLSQFQASSKRHLLMHDEPQSRSKRWSKHCVG